MNSLAKNIDHEYIATKEQLEKFEIIGLGTGIHWPEIDEDLSVEGIVLGIPTRF